MGRNVRDWLHVEDHCEAIDLIIHKGQIGEHYNVGGNNEETNLELIKKILVLFKKSEEMIEYVPDRPGHDMRYSLDNTKIEKELNWYPKMNFEKGIQKTIDWYINNKDWWSKLKNKK